MGPSQLREPFRSKTRGQSWSVNRAILDGYAGSGFCRCSPGLDPLSLSNLFSDVSLSLSNSPSTRNPRRSFIVRLRHLFLHAGRPSEVAGESNAKHHPPLCTTHCTQFHSFLIQLTGPCEYCVLWLATSPDWVSNSLALFHHCLQRALDRRSGLGTTKKRSTWLGSSSAASSSQVGHIRDPGRYAGNPRSNSLPRLWLARTPDI